MQLDTIVHSDALDFLRTLPDGSVDMIFTDPPYGHNNNNNDLIARRENALGQSTEVQPKRPIANDGIEANELYKTCLKEYARILKAGAVCCCCCCGGGPDPQFARWSLWMDEVLEFKQMVVWDKGPMGMGWHYRRSYETVLVGMKKGAACKWYDETNAVENIIRPVNGTRKITPSKTDHPTAKPVSLAAHFISLHTRENELVLDPFAGGGSTLLAARQLNRRYIGVEIDAQWAQYSRDRLANDYTMPMFASRQIETLRYVQGDMFSAE